MNNGKSFAQIKPALVKRVILTDLDDVEFDEVKARAKPVHCRSTHAYRFGPSQQFDILLETLSSRDPMTETEVRMLHNEKLWT